MALARRFAQGARLSWRERSDLLKAVWCLALASRKLAPGAQVDVARLTAKADEDTLNVTPADDELVARVAWAIPRAALVVPWRADCLRQAEAARAWLARCGLKGELKLGAQRNVDGRLEIHAWLFAGRRVVTGGDISSYTPFRASASRRR